MEIISSIALLTFFSFLYFTGRKDEDYPIEFLGAFGILMLGILVVSLELTMFKILDTGDILLKQIPTTEFFGWIVFLTGFIMMLLSIRTISKLGKGAVSK